MTAVRRRTLLASVAVLAVLATTVAPAYADHLEGRKRDLDRRLAAQVDDLHESSAAVRRAAAALSRIAVELPQAERRLAVAEGRLAAAAAREAGLRAALDAANARVAAAERDRAAAQRRLTAARETVGTLARTAYIHGPAGHLAVLLEAESPADLLARRESVRALFRRTDEAVEAAALARAAVASLHGETQVRRQRVAAVQAEAAAALDRLRSVAADAAAARADVARQVAARRGALAVAERERAADLRRYRALQAESRRLAELIRRAPRPTAPRTGVRGMLWPTPGPVTSGYGWRMHPIYRYRRFHPGIDIGAPSGQGVVAVLAGTVVHAGPLGTYGNLVVVDHGGGLSTAYAHLSDVLVRAGAAVAKGARIGRVGSTGASTGPHLHFETRVGGEPVDPMRYY